MQGFREYYQNMNKQEFVVSQKQYQSIHKAKQNLRTRMREKPRVDEAPETENRPS